jgi:hypothetical protein
MMNFENRSLLSDLDLKTMINDIWILFVA